MITKKSSNKKSFFYKILFLFIAVSLLATLTLTIFLSLNYIKSSVSIVKKYNQNLLQQTNYAIDQMNQQVDLFTELLLNDANVISFLQEKTADNLSSVYLSASLEKQLTNMTHIESIYLYNASASTFFSSKTGTLQPLSTFEDRDAARLVLHPNFNSSDYRISIAGKSNPQNETIISYYMFDSKAANDEPKNAIVINVFPAFLADSINSINQFNNTTDTSFIVFDHEGNTLCSVLNPQLKAVPDFAKIVKSIGNSYDDSPIIKINKIRYLKSVTNHNENSWSLINLIPIRVLLQDILIATVVGTSIMILVQMICFVLCFHFTKQLNNPIQAIMDILRGKTNSCNDFLHKTSEFDSILSSFESLQKQNHNLELLQQKIVSSSRQSCLVELILGKNTNQKKMTAEKLHDLGLTYLLESPLCMIIFKIDHYQSLCEKNSTNELWVLRFAIMNIIKEVTCQNFTCDILSQENDRFILLLDCNINNPQKRIFTDIEKTITKIQSSVKHYTKFTMTAAYSPIFHGLEHLSNIIYNLEDSLMLKMKYGHEALISPIKVDEMNSDTCQFPTSSVEQLITFITDGENDASLTMCRQIMSHFFCYDYDEIFSGTIHLLYSIYFGVQKKYPQLKETYTLLLKDYLSKLPKAEITDDLSDLMDEFTCKICKAASTLVSENVSDNAIVNRIIQIIQKEYPNSSLCLSYIADEIGLTPNYIGKIFKSNVQTSVSQYILNYRMETLGKYLRETKLPLNIILDKVGIEKTNYFYTQFKKHFGVSLMEYRLTKES